MMVLVIGKNRELDFSDVQYQANWVISRPELEWNEVALDDLVTARFRFTALKDRTIAVSDATGQSKLSEEWIEIISGLQIPTCDLQAHRTHRCTVIFDTV